MSDAQVFRTACALCRARCGMKVWVENGRMVKVEGDREHPVSRGYLCAKGRAVPELMYAPDRLQHPLRKEGGTWHRIPWDEALETVATKLKEIKEKHGPQAVVIHKGEAVGHQAIKGYVQRFCDVYGTPNFSSSGSQCHVARLMGNALTYGCLPVPDYENARCIVVWGCNPVASNPPTSQHIREARARGARLIVVDPALSPLAEKADLHLQLRPGTDGALALAMLNVILSESLYDRGFVAEWTLGFDELAEHVRDYPPERVAEITWIPAGAIRQAARLYATTRPACIGQGLAVEHHTNAVQGIRAIAALQAVTGNLDVPGGVVMSHGAPLADLTLRPSSSVESVGALEHPLYREFASQAQANLLAEAILTGRPYPIKALIVVGANPLLTFPNAHRLRSALGRLEFLAVMDLFMTETAKLAHLVLPAATFLERAELHDYGRHGGPFRIILADKILAEQGESWPDAKFWFELARKMGYGQHFPWADMEEAIAFQLKPLDVTAERLRKEPLGLVYGHREYRKYERRGFKTPSSKVELYSARLEALGYGPLPVYREPHESPLSQPDLAASYPLILTTGARISAYVHSRLRNLPSLRQMAPEPWVEIHPDTAGRLGIEDGEEVIIESLRGRIEARARAAPSLDPRVVRMAHGWSEANANILTDDEARDPISGFPAFRSLLCRIMKIPSQWSL